LEGDFRGEWGNVLEFEDLGESTRDSENSAAASWETARDGPGAAFGLVRFFGFSRGGFASSVTGAFSLSEEWNSSLFHE
jgi:hypothetical protein